MIDEFYIVTGMIVPIYYGFYRLEKLLGDHKEKMEGRLTAIETLVAVCKHCPKEK